ncbi:M48 family metallopeptidase [Bifidobacterium sp. UTBIF-68]|uniref:tetratricopeptide repeat protein n=1 Tax=Bifidobacterium sp. UTBIF-68 TaxID=1465262 RepID=UPI0011269C21|nr:hypothetical protein [Bifidobacterium sp. UTBIF-68]
MATPSFDIRSCFQALGEALSRPLNANQGDAPLRSQIITGALRILEKYGLAEDVLRYGFASHVTIPLLFRAMGLAPNDLYPEQLMDRWRQILLKGSCHDATRTLSDRYMMLTKWMASANLKDIIELKSPSDDEWDKLRLTPSEDAAVSEQYQWLCDRYLIPDPNAWLTTSLHREYRYIVDNEIGDFPERAVTRIPIRQSELIEIIARRAVYSSDESILKDHLYTQVYESALAYLKKDNYEQASTLFDFFLRQYPGNLAALNAKGFCLIPVDPGKAGKMIRQAIDSGLKPRNLGEYNICFCQLLQGKVSQTLQNAEKYWCEFRGHDTETTPAVLWSMGSNGKPVLISTESVDSSLTRLCANAADSIGDNERQEMWWKRGEKIDGTLSTL